MVSSNYQEVASKTNSWQNNWQNQLKQEGDCFRFQKKFDARKGDRHKLDRKTRHWRDFLKQENYHLTSLEEILKSVLSGGRENPYLTLRISNKNLFFLKGYVVEPYYLERQRDFLFCHLVRREREEFEELLAKRPRQFRKKWEQIKVKAEIMSKWDSPAKLVAGYREKGRPRPTGEGVGWSSDGYWEPKNRSLASLAFTQEIVLGKVDAPLLDLDPNKKNKDGSYKIKTEWLRKALVVGGKKWRRLISKYRIPYYWTTGTPGNSLLPVPFWLLGWMLGGKVYHRDTGEKVGDLLGLGDLVALPVGGDKNRRLVITEWGQKLVKKHGTEGVFRKKLLSGDIKEEVEGFLNSIFLSLEKGVGTEKGKVCLSLVKGKLGKLERKEVRDVVGNVGQLRPEKSRVRAKVLSKGKTPLVDLWKVFYQDEWQKSGYFLLNDYQKEGALGDLGVGEVRDILLVKGQKHEFLSQVVG